MDGKWWKVEGSGRNEGVSGQGRASREAEWLREGWIPAPGSYSHSLSSVHQQNSRYRSQETNFGHQKLAVTLVTLLFLHQFISSLPLILVKRLQRDGFS